MMKYLFLLAFFIATQSGVSQSLLSLKKIGQGTPNTQSGLSQIFTGDLLKDGNVYFLGSHDGFTRDLWRTDGTSNGTFKIIGEGNPNSWKTVRFVEDGVFLQMGDVLAFYKAGMFPVRNLGTFEDLSFVQPEKMDTSRYIFLAERNDTACLVHTDLTAAGSFVLGDIGPYNGFMKMYASPYGAVVYNTNAFVDYEPMMYDAMADTILQVREFLAPYKSVTRVNEVAMYQHYLFLEVSEGGTKRYVFDLRTHTFYPGQYFFGVIERFYPHGDDLIIVSEREITRMDTTTYVFKEFTEDVFPLGTHLVDGDRIYYHGYSTNDTVYVFTLDLVEEKITRLPHGQIGKNFYNSQFAIHDEELYYLRDFGPTTFLTRYDFTDSVAVDIDSITVRNGGLVIYNALIEVKGELLVSKFSPEEWHELYYLEATTSTHEPVVNEVKVFPNPCGNEIYFSLEVDGNLLVTVYTMEGHVVIHRQRIHEKLDVSSLPEGFYSGMIEADGCRYPFSFMKIRSN